MESHDAEFSEHDRTPTSKEAAFKLWLNSAYGRYSAMHGGIPQPTNPPSEYDGGRFEVFPVRSPETTQPQSVETPRGESEPPRKKDAGERGWTDLTLEDAAEMYAIHTEHMVKGKYTDCACVELCEKALEKILKRAQHKAEEGGLDGGRAFRYALLKVAEEL